MPSADEAQPVTDAYGFLPGSVSVGLYANGSSAAEQVGSLLMFARGAESAGFDGISVSEHHAGFPGYVPSPILVASWLLGESSRVWVGACPVLLPLRSAGLVAEEAAWSAVRFPGRFVLGLAPGYVAADFDVAGVDLATRQTRYWAELPAMVARLSGLAAGPLADDPAVQQCAHAPVPVLSGAAGPLGARRAAAADAGVVLGSFTPPARAAELFDAYRAAGGTGARVLIRRCWLGELRSGSMAELLRGYQRAAGRTGFLADGSAEQILRAPGPEQLAESIATTVRLARASAVSLRFQLPGIEASEIADQIGAVGASVLPALRERLADGGQC
jgi:alkanesulfonate monooxygenase SsuD/methylene tetrahydromethanopterin reductase-like flavin-dependent oxidoreductase (luciferase family)